MVVDHTIAFPSNFPQNVKNIDVSAKNIYKNHNTLECGVMTWPSLKYDSKNFNLCEV